MFGIPRALFSGKLSQSVTNKNQLDSLIFLRSIAVLMVCFCHFGHPLSNGHIFSNLFNMFHEYGKFGVHVFFVISGFIIPFSLYKGKYCLSDYSVFLYKRFLRLHPPYIAALALSIIILYFTCIRRHIPFLENPVSIVKSLVYLHIPVNNPVFWTLIVEAQYYFFIGIFYILLMQNTKVAYFVVIPIILVLSKIFNVYFSLQLYFVFFFIGNVGYMIYTKNGLKVINIILLTSLLGYTAYFYETPAVITSLFTIAFILLFKKSIHSYFKFLGAISYSVYLIHFPIGVMLIKFVKSKIELSYSWLLFTITLITILILSWIFYKTFEVFSESLSKKVKYNSISKKQIKIGAT